MPIHILNRFGPICFESSTLNFSSGSSINSLFENFSTVVVQDLSLSASLSQLVTRKGNFYLESAKDVSVGVGASLTNYDNSSQIRFSSFYNSSYLSASILQENDGVVTIKTYSPSVITTNNFFTGNPIDQVFKYSLYTKVGTSVPIVDSGWNKVYSYTKSGNNVFNFYDLVDSNSYKITVQDCLSNAFTSSLFVGNCTDIVNTENYYSFTVKSLSFDAAISLIKAEIINNAANLSLDQRLDLLNNILNVLKPIITNTKLYKSSQNSLNPIISYRDSGGYIRYAKFDGLVFQNTNKNYIFNGTVHAYSVAGPIKDYYYSFEDTSTAGSITIHILSRNVKTGTNCQSSPSNVGYIPSTVYIQGPICGKLDCGTGKTQVICDPTLTSQVRHSSSFTITNENDDPLTVSMTNDPLQWSDFNGNSIDDFLLPIVIQPSLSTVIPPKSFKKFSIGFGTDKYNFASQPSSFQVRGRMEFSLPNGLGYEPRTRVSELKAVFDKNTCLIGVKSPYLISQASNIENVFYTGLINETWQIIKNKISSFISSGYGTTSDKIYGRGIISALPLAGCELPISITQDGVVLSLSWTLLTSTSPQSYVCNDNQFSGTYNVAVTNSTYGTSTFYIYFLRKNDSSLGAYINLTQLGGTSNPF